jgi:hypothetical protein
VWRSAPLSAIGAALPPPLAPLSAIGAAPPPPLAPVTDIAAIPSAEAVPVTLTRPLLPDDPAHRRLRNREGRTRRLTIGSYGKLTPTQARKEARQKLADAERGGDPSEERHQERRVPTVKEFAQRYLEQHAIPKKKPSSVATDRGMLKNYLVPQLGHGRCRRSAWRRSRTCTTRCGGRRPRRTASWRCSRR